MHLLAAVLAAGAATAPAPAGAPAAPGPVQVLSETVALQRDDAAPIRLRCTRTARACRGVLVVGYADCSGVPVLQPGCQRVLGSRRFAIGPRRTRTLVVRASSPDEHRTDAPDAFDVRVTPYRGRRPNALRTRRTRTVQLVAGPALDRPPVPVALRSAVRLSVGRDALRFEIAAPLGTTRATITYADREVALHPEGYAPYVVPRRSFAVGGALWHGELPVGRDELRAGERHPFTLTTCNAAGCSTATGTRTLERDRSNDPQPICRLRPLTAVR